jgi:hypothetical protein
MEFEDFEVMLATLSRKIPASGVEQPVEAPIPLVTAKQRK